MRYLAGEKPVSLLRLRGGGSDWGALVPPRVRQDASLAIDLQKKGKTAEEITAAIENSHIGPSIGDEYRIKPQISLEGTAGYFAGVYAEGALNEKEFIFNGGLTSVIGARVGATVTFEIGLISKIG
ncbi:polymorphic toxin type 25 domain-containing protein [Brenneria tiliae]|uniref:polymorphic toxin type 25 domain-containing protein n=1 Tax=Brenneria tiliae TaxID=2914984 RepID=UPI00320473A2